MDRFTRSSSPGVPNTARPLFIKESFFRLRIRTRNRQHIRARFLALEIARDVRQNSHSQVVRAKMALCDFLPPPSRRFPPVPTEMARFAIGHIGHSNAASFN